MYRILFALILLFAIAAPAVAQGDAIYNDFSSSLSTKRFYVPRGGLVVADWVTTDTCTATLERQNTYVDENGNRVIKWQAAPALFFAADSVNSDGTVYKATGAAPVVYFMPWLQSDGYFRLTVDATRTAEIMLTVEQ